jgi:hypothetical protein
MTWSRRAENIRKRDWADVLDQWAEFGAEFDTARYLRGSLERSIESLSSADALAGNNVCVVEFEQRVTFLSELVFSQVKSNHAFICAIQRIKEGNATWGVTDAYHAAMLLMRSILAAFGVFICRAYNRMVLVDAFPWLGRLDEEKKFKKQHKNWKRCAAVISSVSRDFTQTDLYGLFQRVITISTVPPEVWPEIVVQNILNTEKTHFSSSRNQLIYGSRFWFNPDDLLGECLSLRWVTEAQRNIAAYAFTKTDGATEMDCYCDCWVLFLMSSRLHAAIYKSFDDSAGIFGYIDARKPDLALIERQFSGQF